MSIEEIKDLSIRIVGNLVNEGLIKDCTDTDDELEFEIQDEIRLQLALHFGYYLIFIRRKNYFFLCLIFKFFT
jgi:hypothetical protein